MSQTGLINPVNLDKLQPLSKAEEMFVACMATPVDCKISDHRPEVPADDRSNVVRADLIRFFAWGGNDEHQIKGNSVVLCGAYVEGVLNLTHIPSPHALTLLNCRFPERIYIAHSKFWSLDMGGSFLAKSLIAKGVRMDGDLSMTSAKDAFVAECGVNLIGANIGGDIYCDGGIFKSKEDGDNNKGQAVTADRVKIGGNAFLRSGFKAEGEVRFLGSVIAGDLDCNGGNFESKERCALIADKARVGGNFLMGAGDDSVRFCANGNVHLISANITGNLDCGGGKFMNEGKNAFAADGVKVGGELQMNSSDKGVPFFTNGDVCLVAANIGVSWVCKGGIFGGNISAESVKIGNSMSWSKVCAGGTTKHQGRGTVNLRGAAVDIFDYDEQSRDGFDFILDGFSYRQFAEHKDVQSRIKWLDNRPAGKPFSPQPFEHAAKVLFAMGRDNDAREILLAKEERLTELGNMSGALRFCRKLWDLFAGYGYQLRKTLAWAAVFVVWGMVIFKYADHSCRIFPHQPLVTVQGKYAKEKVQHCAVERLPTRVVEENFPEYPEFNALAYSLDVFIPFFALHQESHWYPQVQKGDGFLMFYFLRFWFWLEVAAGWLLTSLAVLSITGLLRPRQSSGDKE